MTNAVYYHQARVPPSLWRRGSDIADMDIFRAALKAYLETHHSSEVLNRGCLLERLLPYPQPIVTLAASVRQDNTVGAQRWRGKRTAAHPWYGSGPQLLVRQAPTLREKRLLQLCLFDKSTIIALRRDEYASVPEELAGGGVIYLYSGPRVSAIINTKDGDDRPEERPRDRLLLPLEHHRKITRRLRMEVPQGEVTFVNGSLKGPTLPRRIYSPDEYVMELDRRGERQLKFKPYDVVAEAERRCAKRRALLEDPEARARWLRETATKYQASTNHLRKSTIAGLKLLRERLARVEEPWTRLERTTAGVFLVDRIIKYRRMHDVPREKIGFGLTQITLGRLERALECDQEIAPNVATIRKLANALEDLVGRRFYSKRRGMLTEEAARARFKELEHPLDPIEQELAAKRPRFRKALARLDLYSESYATVGTGVKARTIVHRSGLLWEGLKACKALKYYEKPEHVGDAYEALTKEYDNNPEAVPLEDPEALAKWVKRTVKRTGGYTYGQYGSIQVTSAVAREKSHRSKTIPEHAGGYLNKALAEVMEEVDFELADDGDPVHEVLTQREVGDRLRGGDSEFEVLMLAAPPTYRKPQGGVLPGYHYVKPDGTVHTLGELYMYDAKKDRKALELGTIEEWLAARGIPYDGKITYRKPLDKEMIHFAA